MTRHLRFASFAALALLASCAPTPPPDPADGSAPPFDPLAFFAGRSHGDGRLRILWKQPHAVTVESEGRREVDGTLVLDQRISEVGKPPRQRTWRIRATGPGRYAGTLTDARGPVLIESDGNLLRIRYTGRDGLDYRQWLALSRDGRSAHNILAAGKFGLRLGVLDETIRRIDGAPGGAGAPLGS